MSRWRKRYILLTRLYWAARKEEGSARAISCGCHNRALPALFADPYLLTHTPAIGQVANTKTGRTGLRL